MPVLLREGVGAIFQLACQQPDGSPAFRAWEGMGPKGRRLTWRNKPDSVDACLLTIGPCGGAVYGFALLQGDRYAIAAGKGVEVRDARNGDLLETLGGGDSDVRCVSARNGLLCAGFQDGTLKVWNAGV